MPTDFLYRSWDLGQHHLAAGRYPAARRALEAAEALAFRTRDAHSLSRLYLPLLEARRQIRYHAVEGAILILPTHAAPLHRRAALKPFLSLPAGTLLLPAFPDAARTAHSIAHAAQRTGRFFETLLLPSRRGTIRLAAPAAPAFAAGLPVRFSPDPAEQIGPSTDPALTVPLPPPNAYTHGPQHAQARESLLIAWEALALRWQHLNPPRLPRKAEPRAAAWAELDWLRRTLAVDPACEPVAMRLIRIAEQIQRL